MKKLRPSITPTGVCLTLLLLVAPAVRAQLCPDEPPLPNHGGSGRTACACFVPGEQAGAIFNLPASAFPIEILEVRIGWGSQFGGSPAAVEQAIHVYPAGLPNPGAPIFTWPGPTLVDGAINAFDIESLPGQVIVNGGPFLVAVEFLNQSSGNLFQPSVVHDGNGCQPGRNAVFAVPGGWNDACLLGVTGDWVFELLYRPVTCARCAAGPPLVNNTGAGTVPCACFIPGEQAGAVLTIPAADLPAEITKVRVRWDSQFGGAPPQLEQALHVYQGGLPNPGAPIFTLPGPTLLDGALNEFDLEALPGAVIVNSSPVTVTVEFLNQNSGSPFTGTVSHDNNGCQPGKNAVLAQPGGWNDACLLGVPGDWVVEAEYKPIACPGAGRVPDGDLVPGTPLMVTPQANGFMKLDWGASCSSADTDYEVYEGTIGTFYSHTSALCSTSGATTVTLNPAAGSTYYVVAPHDGTNEGSYGIDSQGTQRPVGDFACRVQQVGSCP